MNLLKREQVRKLTEKTKETSWYEISLFDRLYNSDGHLIEERQVPFWIEAEYVHDLYGNCDSVPFYVRVTDEAGTECYENMSISKDLIEECENWIKENEYEYEEA